MNKGGKKVFYYAGAAIAILVVAAWLLQPAVVLVDVATVERGNFQLTIEEQGRTRPLNRFTVAAPVHGRLLRTRLNPGDRVLKGDVLAHLAPPPEDSRAIATIEAQLAAARARQRESESRLAEAQANARIARSEAQRRADLYERGLVSVEERDNFKQSAEVAVARLISAEASVAAAKADVRTANSRMIGAGDGEAPDAVIIRSPVSGCVLRVYEESERVVAAGSPLFELCDGHQLELVVDLLTEDAVRVRPGNPVIISGWGGDYALQGTVRYVEPGAFTKISALGVEEQRVNVIGDLIDPPAELGAEFRVEAAIVVWQADDVVTIPTSALFRRQGAWYAFVVEHGRAQLREVSVGKRGRDAAQVLDGVSAGDRVIEFPSDSVTSGQRVRVSS